jgi:DNA helicase-4
MTVHGAKGLEAENVIILNMEDDILGFPNKVINDYLLSPLLIQTDTYPLAEERRIFYVALTRGKEQCFLCVPSQEDKQSFFYKEIRDKVTLLGKTSEIMMREQEGETCPRCKSGQLIRKYNKTTKEAFLACSNYNQGEGCHYTREYHTIKH